MTPNVTLNYGVRYDYYTPLHEANNLIVKFNIDTGVIDPEHDAAVHVEEEQLPAARLVDATRPARRCFRTGFGIFVGPGPDRGPDPAGRERPHQLDAVSGAAFPVDSDRAASPASPTTRTTGQYQPRAYANDYTIPERVYQYTASVQRELPGRMAATAAYVGSQGRNLFLRSVANHITQVVTNPNPASAAIVDPRVLDRPARRGRQHHRRPEPVRRGRLQDERRPRQLQRDACCR